MVRKVIEIRLTYLVERGAEQFRLLEQLSELLIDIPDSLLKGLSLGRESTLDLVVKAEGALRLKSPDIAKEAPKLSASDILEAVCKWAKRQTPGTRIDGDSLRELETILGRVEAS